MDMKTLKRANELLADIKEIDRELSAWEEVTQPADLGYHCREANHFVRLPWAYSPRAAFDAYRSACINGLKVRRAELAAEIAAL